MKNCRVFKRFISIILVVAMQLNTVSLTAKIDTQKLKEFKERMNFLKNAHEDYKGSLREYDKCVQKNCVSEIEALKKANEDLSKVGLKDIELRNIVMGAKETADENFKQCTAKYCDDIKKNLQKSERNFTLKVLAVVGVLTAAFIGLAIVRPIIGKKLKISKLIKKYGLSDTPQTRKLLSDRYAYVNLEEGSEITDSLRDAMAEVYFEHEPNEKEKRQFDALLEERKISIGEALR